MSATRAERRRAKAAERKIEQYAKSGFRDRAVYVPVQPHVQHKPYTTDELHQRAVERRDQKRIVEKMVREQVDASKTADKERRQTAKATHRAAYLAGFAKPQPVHHMHSAARRLAAALPIAA